MKVGRLFLHWWLPWAPLIRLTVLQNSAESHVRSAPDTLPCAALRELCDEVKPFRYVKGNLLHPPICNALNNTIFWLKDRMCFPSDDPAYVSTALRRPSL